MFSVAPVRALCNKHSVVLGGEERRRHRDVEKEAVAGERLAISKALPCPDLEKGRSDGKWICI